jgi:S-adenosylmethionine-diacylglycerol 3-amino-3-carboxypropyl transferase
MAPTANPSEASELRAAPFFEAIGYSTVWEDERMVEEALRPRPGERALSVTSAGCTSLLLLLRDAGEVVSVDFNPHQTALLQLGAAAVAALEAGETWELMGLRPCADRARLYAKARDALPEDARIYWDLHPEVIARGPTRAGRQDRYLLGIGRALRLLQGERRVARLLACDGGEPQRAFFDGEWSGPLWRALCAVVFSRFVLDRSFDRAHFKYAREGAPSRRFRANVERFLREVPARENFYLHYLLRGTYADDERCPAWLRRGAAELLRPRLGRLRAVTGSLEDWIVTAPDASVDLFNLSNAFDWMSEARFEWFMGQAVRVARPGARLWWTTNIVNTRRVPSPERTPGIELDGELASRLDSRCRTPGYQGCTVAVVRK